MNAEQNGPRLVTGGLTSTISTLRSDRMADSHFATQSTTTCREFLGRRAGLCREPVIDGDYCPVHDAEREAWYARHRS